MNITAKSRYALKVMIDLALFSTKELQQRSSLAERQGIPIDYMDHILQRLKSSELIKTVRGRGGGLCLGRNPEDISAWDIVKAVEDITSPVQCIVEPCGHEDSCFSKDAWELIYLDIVTSLKSRTLSALVHQEYSKQVTLRVSARECKAPSKR